MNPEVIKAILGSLVLLAGLGGTGGAILRLTGHTPEKKSALELMPIAVAIGFAVFSYLGYLLVRFAPLNPAVVLILAIGGAVAGYRYWLSVLSETRSILPAQIKLISRPVPILFTLLTLVVLFLVAMNALTPVKEGDALQGYMFTARWLSEHGMVFSPYNPRYSLMPINTELVFSLSFPFGTDLIAKTLDGFLGLFSLLAVYEFARPYAGRLYSFFAAAGLGLMAEFIDNWSSGKIDIAVFLVFFAGFSLLFGEVDRPSFRTLSVAAFLVGTACSQKYTVWILALTLPVWIWLIYRRESWRRIRSAVLLSSLIVGLCVVPHLIKNVAWAHNPLAPFAQSLFRSQTMYLPHESDSVRMRLADVPLFPIKIFFDSGNKSRPGPFPLMLLLGIPLFLLMSGKPETLKYVSIIAALQLAVWIVIRQEEWLTARFLLLPIALLLVVSAWALESVCRKNRIARSAAVVIMVSLFWSSGILAYRHRRAALPFVLGLENRPSWQDRMAPARGYAALHAVAPLLGEHRRIMIGASLYNLPEEKLVYAGTEEELARFNSLTEDERLAYLKENGFGFFYYTHKGIPGWAKDLPVFAEGRDGASLEYKLFEIVDSSRASDLPFVTAATRAPGRIR